MKQRGIALIELLIALSILSVVMNWVSNYKTKEHFESVVDKAVSKLSQEITLIQQYEAESAEDTGSVLRFPSSPNDLINKGYAESCSLSQHNRGNCSSVAYTVWGNTITYARINGEGDDTKSTHLQITYPLTSFKNSTEATKVARLMMQRIPFATYNSTSKAITFRVNRSNASVMMAGFLAKDGSTELEDDWDVGGDYAITNAKDVTIRNSNGSQTIVSRGLSHAFTVNHGDWLNKPACPSNSSPSLNLALGYVRVSSDYELVGSQKPFLMAETSTRWRVGLELRVKHIDTGSLEIENSGEILVITQCK